MYPNTRAINANQYNNRVVNPTKNPLSTNISYHTMRTYRHMHILLAQSNQFALLRQSLYLHILFFLQLHPLVERDLLLLQSINYCMRASEGEKLWERWEKRGKEKGREVQKQSQLGKLYEQIRDETYLIFKAKYFEKYKQQPQGVETVICSFWLGQIGGSGSVVSVGFGTKSLPYTIAKQLKGQVIKDMHAEILARRGLIKYLIANLPQQGKDSQIFSWVPKKSKHRVNPKLSLILFSNQIFCGDCMIDIEQNCFSGSKPLKHFLNPTLPQQKYLQHCLRTKPGRLDLPISSRSLSLSCSDKIAVWNILGVQGKLLFNYMLPLYVDRIVIETQRNVDLNVVDIGVSVVERVCRIFGSKKSMVLHRLFRIQIEGRVRDISGQFFWNKPVISLLRPQSKTGNQQKPNPVKLDLLKQQAKPKIDQPKQQQMKEKNEKQHKNQNTKQNKKLELCGIIVGETSSWIVGKTGLPEGVSIKKPTKTSPFCSNSLYKNMISRYEQQFKYHAIKDRIKQLFGEWTSDYKQNTQKPTNQ